MGPVRTKTGVFCAEMHKKGAVRTKIAVFCSEEPQKAEGQNKRGVICAEEQGGRPPQPEFTASGCY